MCGIVGYVGPRNAREVVLAGLERLEMRGYDSAGVCLHEPGGLARTRTVGGPAALRSVVPSSAAGCGLGHTRWATHGPVTEENTHPFWGCREGELALALNGIVENHAELRAGLSERGHVVRSETDAEVVAHLIEEHYDGDLAAAVRSAAAALAGQFAILVAHRDHPDTLVGTRRGAPLVVGVGEGEAFPASAVAAFRRETDTFLVLEDGEVVTVAADGTVDLANAAGERFERRAQRAEWELDTVELGAHETFMIKEIHDQPRALAATLEGCLRDGRPLGDVELQSLRGADLTQIVILGCGTSLNAGAAGRLMLQRWGGVPASAEVASEWRHSDPFVGPGTLVVAVSQSGETADTLAALRLARELGARTVAVTNEAAGQITREADAVVLTRAGHETSVAATKTFACQLAALACLALRVGLERGHLALARAGEIISELLGIPEHLERRLAGYSPVAEIAERLSDAPFFLYLGREAGVPTCNEGALKMREIAYAPTEAYPAGEMKHGPIALIEADTPVVCVATVGPARDKLLANIEEVRARGAHVIAIASEGDEEIQHIVDDTVYVAEADPLLAPLLAVVPLQLLAYHVARTRGLDVDRPRNLAKTVTVE